MQKQEKLRRFMPFGEKYCKILPNQLTKILPNQQRKTNTRKKNQL
jgi:hypothetical protein